MTVMTRTKLAGALLTAALAFTACGGATPTVEVNDSASDATVATAVPTQAPADTSTTDDSASTDDAAPADDTATADAGSTAGVGEFRAVVTVDGEDMVFELWQCGDTLGNFYAAGVGAEGTSPDSELQLSREIPFPGDGEDARLDNSFTITFGTDSYKAGTVQGDVGEGTWGALDWTLDGEVLTGTATLEHSWGSNPGPDRQAVFVVSCV